MKTPKFSYALFPLLLASSLHAMDINPALRGLGDYPYTSPRQQLLNKGGPSLAPPVILGIQHIQLNYIEIHTLNFPTPPFDPNSIKLNLDVSPTPQLMFTPPNPLTPPAPPATPAPSATPPATSPKR